ncbi:site-specific tyrosine recombinase XerD [Micrococcus lacusdianchii]|uniref:site-specific tyrosine recombinase XerD n=1 Tax=Micrococcus lacusdianchii TaxID=2915940 RepID=UPI0020040380|nr:site-specific tyrosine recombinase XerD [uncultured Micrococcus sp.]
MTAPALEGAVRRHLDHLAVERGLAENTLAAYRRDLARYAAWLAASGVGAPEEVDAGHVTGFVAALGTGGDGGRPLAPRSVARVLAAVRGLHRFWALEGLTPTDPAADVAPPAAPERLPRALSVDAVTRLLEAVPVDSPAGLRDRALLEFLYGTGARVSEAVGLDVDDVVGVTGEHGDDVPVVRLFGKGSKERIVPVGSYAAEALAAWLVRGRPALVAGARPARGTPALFLNLRGGRLSRQSAWSVITAAADRAGLAEEVSPHTLRHSFATHLMQGGADVRVVQELLGHASVTTTQVYTRVTAEALREVYAQAHPRARWADR